MNQRPNLLENQILFQKLFEALSHNEKLDRSRKLCSFSCKVGNQYNHDIMIVGRALNGWNSQWTLDELANTEKREKILNRTLEDSGLSWVIQSWGTKLTDLNGRKYYNTKKSAFWRTIKSVSTSALDIKNDDWANCIAWTNLYKVAHGGEDKGNPSNELRRSQFEMAKDILFAEIRTLKPKNIIFFTGLSWLSPFIDGIGLQEIHNAQYVKQKGRMVFDDHVCNFIVAPHPQGKKEKTLVLEILENLDLENGR